MKISNACLFYLLSQGLTQSQIAKLCNVTRQAVSFKLKYKSKRNEIQLRWFCVKFLRRLGFSKSEIYKLLNMSPHTVYNILNKSNFLKNDITYD